MLKNNEEILYTIINENLDLFLDDDLLKTYDNIKEFSIYFDSYCEELFKELNTYTPITEASFINYIGSYFTDRKNSYLSRLFTAGIIGTDLALGSIATGSLNSIIATKLGLVFGASVGSITASMSPFIILVAGFAISSYLKESEIRNTNKLIKISENLSAILKARIKVDQNEFKSYVTTSCGIISDKKSKIECASRLFVANYNRYVADPIITEYIKYLKDNRINISGINSFEQLFNIKDLNNSNLQKLINQYYYYYTNSIRIFAKYDKALVGKSFSYLNQIVRKNI
jgi:hypothetical protein